MRKIVIERELTRYVDKYFVAVRREFNKLRTDWRLQPVEQSSMKSWCRTERKLARNAVSIEPFVVPTTSSTTANWRALCAAFVKDVGSAPLGDEGLLHVDTMRRIASASDGVLESFVDEFSTIVVDMRTQSFELSGDDVNERQFTTIRLFHEKLLYAVGNAFEEQFVALMQKLGVSRRPSNASYSHALQELWNAFGLAIHHRRIDHVPYVKFDIAVGRGGQYYRFTDMEMTTLYYVLGYAGSRVLDRFAVQMSLDALDDYSVVASAIYGDPTVMAQYKYAQKVKANQHHGLYGGTLCWPPVDLYIRMLNVARAVYSTELRSVADCNKLTLSVSSEEFLAQCRSLIAPYGVAAFGAERMQSEKFANVYYRMMLRLMANFALTLSKIRAKRITAELLQPSAQFIAQTQLGKDGAKTLSLKASLIALRSKSIKRTK